MNDCVTRLLSESVLRTVQELHRYAWRKKRLYPANTDHNGALKARSRTNRVEERQKLDRLFLPNQHTNRGSLEPIVLAELVLEKTEVGGSDIVRVSDK